MSDNNQGAILIRALKLPLRDVHDVCSTGDVEYLVAFAQDESHRAEKGLGRAHSPSRKTTAPIRRAEILQASKVAEKAAKIAEKKELRARQKRKDAAKERRLAEADAENRVDSRADAYSEDGIDSEDGGKSPKNDHNNNAAAVGGGATADDHDQNEDEVRTTDSQISEAAIKNPLLASGAGATDADKVSHLQVFPRPRLGQTQAAATEEAIFNTVGMAVVSMHDLINYRDEHGFLPIHTACVFGHVNIVEFLVEHGADIESQVPRTLYRPLHLAVLNGHDFLARKLVEAFNADPGALTAKFELPLTIAARRRAAVEQLFYKEKCFTRIRSKNALEAAKDGDVLFFAYHIEVDEDKGKKLFTDDAASWAHSRSEKNNQRQHHAAAAEGVVTAESIFQDAVSNPLDVAIASCTQAAISQLGADASSPFFIIAKLLLTGKYYNVNELRESSVATTTLYMACSIPVSREAIKLLLDSKISDADPRIASTFNAAPNQIIKLMLSEAEARMIFDETYATRDAIEFSDREDFIVKVAELRMKWKMASHKLKKALEREEVMNAGQ